MLARSFFPFLFMHSSRCPAYSLLIPSSRSRKWPFRDVVRLWRVLLPVELVLLLYPRGFLSLSDAALAGLSTFLLSSLLRRHWGQHHGHGAAMLMLPVIAGSALGWLPRPDWGLVLLVLTAAHVLSHLRRFILPAVMAAALTAGLDRAGADTLQSWSGKADITFDGTSTLHNWGGKVSAKPFQTQVTLDAEGKPKRVQAEVVVEAAKMDTAEPKRDENMRKAMKVTEHPLIQAAIDVPADKIAADLRTPTQLPMTLTLLGKPQQINGTISRFQRKDGKVTFDLDFPVSMKASGISVPSVLIFIRVGDGVKVHASVTLVQP